MTPKSRRQRKLKELLFVGLFFLSVIVSLAALVVLFGRITIEALPALRPSILFNFASFSTPARAGYAAAIAGTLWVVGLTMLFSLPLGIAAGVYLEEYAPRNRITRFLQASISNLAGVPSIVFGLIGLAVFSRAFHLGFTTIAGALTLTILVFPYVVITVQEAIRAVPPSIREGAIALGSTKWQAIRGQVLPAGTPGILTASILAASRAMGESAPLIVISSAIQMTFLPAPDTPFSVLPVQIFTYITLANPEYEHIAAAGILVLLALLLTFNSIAIVIRNRMQRQRW